MRDNVKVRSIYNMLLNNTNIRRVQEKPVVLQWICDPCDSCDLDSEKISLRNCIDVDSNFTPNTDRIEVNHNIESISNPLDRSGENGVSHLSYGSHRDINPHADCPPSCYYCDETFETSSRQDYQKHVIQKHHKKPCFPGKADIEKYSLVHKGMDWET